MKSGTIVVISLIGLGAVIGGLWLWRNWSTAGEASIPSAFSTTERRFINGTHDFLDAQMRADELAAGRARFESVRKFAASVASEHRNQIAALKDAVLRVESNFEFHTERSGIPPSFETLSGGAFDRAYLDQFTRAHEEQIQMLERSPFPSGSPHLGKFVSLWSPTLQRHLTEAGALRQDLPAVASNLPLLLVTGLFFISATLGTEVYLRRIRRRRLL
jgi:predicted outer membrane protein